jgi:AraC-like DNA-binding protein
MLLYITILGFIITFLLFINLRQSNRTNIYLFFFLLINNLYALSHYATVFSGNRIFAAIMLVHFTPFYLLLGPLFYFYVRGLLKDDASLDKWDLLHFVPAFLFFINISPYLIRSWDFKLHYATIVVADTRNLLKLDYLFLPPSISFLTRPIIAFVYIVASGILIFQRGLNKNYLSKQSSLVYRWLFLLIVTSIFMYLGFLLFTIIAYFDMEFKVTEQNGNFVLYTTILGLFVMNLSLLFFPNIMYGLPQLDYAIFSRKNRSIPSDDDILEANKKARAFEISDEKLVILKNKVDAYVAKKPYLTPDFNLTIMSSDTDIPVHHLSYYFNEHLKVNFNTWKNDLKIAHVISLIENGTGEILTLDALAKQAGFGSRTSFFNSFKQKMGVTPSDYLNNFN